MGRFLFLGRMTGHLRWAIKCPTSYCSLIAPDGAAHHSFALDCAALVLLTRMRTAVRTRPVQSYKKHTPRRVSFITGADDRIISLRFITLQNCACAQPAYCRPPFCGGSTGFFAGSHPHPLHINKKSPVGRFLFLGRMTGFEPATFGTTNQRSNQLSYIRHTVFFVVELIGLEPTTPCMPCKCSTN